MVIIFRFGALEEMLCIFCATTDGAFHIHLNVPFDYGAASFGRHILWSSISVLLEGRPWLVLSIPKNPYFALWFLSFVRYWPAMLWFLVRLAHCWHLFSWRLATCNFLTIVPILLYKSGPCMTQVDLEEWWQGAGVCLCHLVRFDVEDCPVITLLIVFPRVPSSTHYCIRITSF
jgi:hypothetical protein